MYGGRDAQERIDVGASILGSGAVRDLRGRVSRGQRAKSPRVLATAGTLAAARLALRMLDEEGQAASECLMIREAATGRGLRARRR